MKYFIIAGEKSGDLHASNLMKEIKERDPEAEFRFVGGDLMQDQGGDMICHYSEMAYMGFIEVLSGLSKILSVMKECKTQIASYKPDVVICVDFASFNMRIAKWAKTNGFRVDYYISPKVWAWKEKRAYKIKKYIDHLYCILPFEEQFYKKYDFKIDYVGNPLLDSIEAFTAKGNFHSRHRLSEKPIIAILPGSRKQEIESILYVMMSVVNVFPDYQFVIAGVNHFPKEYYEQFIRHDDIHVVYNETYDLLTEAKFAIVCSGTATLETALFNVPQIVCYKTSFISATIVRMLIKVKYVSLVNLVANKEIVKELIQENFTSHDLLEEINKMISDEEYVQNIEKGYKEVRNLLGEVGASKRTAEHIVNYSKN